MTTPTSRIIQMSLGRVSDAGADIGALPLGDAVYGKIQNIAGGHIVYPHTDGFGAQGRDRYWNHTFELEPLTFELLEASEQPESIGPVEIYLNAYTSFKIPGAATFITRVRQHVGVLSIPANGSWDRTTDTPRPMTMELRRVVYGGGAARNVLTKSGAALYADTRTGELLNRVNGTVAQVDHYEAIRVAHGLAASA